ncbi:hypothetical protein Vlu01_37190 [Micromonospora lutea]|uniref:Uncharacterized protein n=1 Tax=Micromonospora lutea TaxID=419825 RepID=A0ABQ4IYV9_9ACTN|nr:hypothetical protein Vlu01_37190 [Micromonospora lutea]
MPATVTLDAPKREGVLSSRYPPGTVPTSTRSRLSDSPEAWYELLVNRISALSRASGDRGPTTPRTSWSIDVSPATPADVTRKYELDSRPAADRGARRKFLGRNGSDPGSA